MNNRLLYLLLILGISIATSEGAINRHVKTKRHSSSASISRVCLVSLDVKMNRVGMKGMEPLVVESEEWGRKLRNMLTHAVTGSGLTMAGDLSADDESMDEPMRQRVLRVRQRYDTVAVQIEKKPGKVEAGSYTLSDEVAVLPCSATADTLLFARATGRLETGGRKAFSLLIGGSAGILMAQDRYELSLAFVDARSGVVTAFTWINTMGGKTGTDPEKALNERLVEEFVKMRPAGARH